MRRFSVRGLGRRGFLVKEGRKEERKNERKKERKEGVNNCFKMIYYFLQTEIQLAYSSMQLGDSTTESV